MKKVGFSFLVFFLLIGNSMNLNAQKTISFYSKDGILITADLYLVNDTLPYMILCHQAESSRGEYLETAVRFSKFGYNCLAIDARSGREINNIKNETAINAKAKNRPTSFMDAEQDILSAIDYAYDLNKKKVILVGSSYSASLIMKIAVDNNNVTALIAFSPSECFDKKYILKENITELNKPLFVTSTKQEAVDVVELVKDVKSKNKQQFTPSKEGQHGSKALWKETANSQEYWRALMMFMLSLK